MLNRYSLEAWMSAQEFDGHGHVDFSVVGNVKPRTFVVRIHDADSVHSCLVGSEEKDVGDSAVGEAQRLNSPAVRGFIAQRPVE